MSDKAALREEILMLQNSIAELYPEDLEEAEELVVKSKELRDKIAEYEEEYQK